MQGTRSRTAKASHPRKRSGRSGAKVPATRRAAATRKPTPSRRRKPADRAQALAIADVLDRLYPEAHCELDFGSPFQLLVATILSAQCTDKLVNQVTPALFARFPDARAMASADLGEVERLVAKTGFFRQKAKNIVASAQAIMLDHDGEVPRTMEALIRLPGVARKTGNVVLGSGFGISEGIAVDTHVTRLAQRLGLSRETEP